MVDPHPYIETCKYDVCACGEKLNCYCNGISRYSEACAKQGVNIKWRVASVIPECGMFNEYLFNLFVLFERHDTTLDIYTLDTEATFQTLDTVATNSSRLKRWT